jgi:DNA-binding SARP family transcriptional activator
MQLGAAALTLCWSEGQAMALEEAAAYALDTLAPANLAAPARDLRIHVLGRSRIYCGDRLLTAADWTYSKARELVFFLLCHPGSTREQIGLAFWPDASAEQVRKRFSAALAHARTALGRQAETIRLVDGRYWLDPAGGFWCDLHEFEARLLVVRRLRQNGQEQQAALALLEEATALYAGSLLEDLAADEWPQGRRLALQEQQLAALLLLGSLHQERAHFDEAIAVYRRALAEDAFAEEAHIEIIRCQARLGRRREALRQYDALIAALAELGAAPSPTAEALALHIRHNQPV